MPTVYARLILQMVSKKRSNFHSNLAARSFLLYGYYRYFTHKNIYIVL